MDNICLIDVCLIIYKLYVEIVLLMEYGYPLQIDHGEVGCLIMFGEEVEQEIE